MTEQGDFAQSVEVVLVRHAEPGPWPDSATVPDAGLTPHGHRQAQAVAEQLAFEGLDAIVQSPARRAAETAAPITGRLGLRPTIVDALAEWDRSALDPGRARELLGEQPTEQEFRAQVGATIEQQIHAHPRARRLVIVCHGGVISAYAGAAVGITAPDWLQAAHASITRIACGRGAGARPRLVSANETGHLRGVASARS